MGFTVRLEKSFEEFQTGFIRYGSAGFKIRFGLGSDRV